MDDKKIDNEIKTQKQRINELRWSLKYLFDIIDEEDDEMMFIEEEVEDH